MDLLRFFTAGNVDDGKSTLIGRLLYDSHSISTDVIETLSKQSKTKGGNTEIDLALLTDGLRAEREQGITIDVAYKYFSTDKRKFVIADTPGHFEYNRNMFTGASNADLAIILVDVRNGMTDQTKRHTIISSILRIPNVLVCINKMDVVNYSEEKFKQIEKDYRAFAEPLKLKDISFIPVSALMGENIVKPSGKMNWYKGKPLLEFLEKVATTPELKEEIPRFQVQYVISTQNNDQKGYRGYAGKVLSGTYVKGQTVVVLPSGDENVIDRLESNQQEIEKAVPNTPVVIHLKDKTDIGRGSTIIPKERLPKTGKEIAAMICWMDHAPFAPGQKMWLQQNSFRAKAIIKEVIGTIDIHSFAPAKSDGIKLNDICRVIIQLEELLSYDSYHENRATGSFILIDDISNHTIAAGTIE